ncbi:MAG: hypothetical protein GX178_09685 [Acidobacteria bacterium]|nr:hypothetical protein [Thermoanaerobaculia bacterium]MDI9630718.1 hypothetical protein [Acidobacteriota bacterium]OQC40592.1 MAG: hypothetical protein BWX64_01427 [Acidobacteria bacterium ADurb.Bin051]MBP7812852.1 hypothetical protein [Thermoanaerobaculia bacterium]NLN11862.1 hypothetical protein [Acidobacteriota bacterium]
MHAERTAPPPPPRRRPRWHPPLLLALLLLAGGNGVGLVRQVRALRAALPYLRTADLPPFAWRARSAPVASLERLLTAVDSYLGPGVRVRVVVPEELASEAHYVRMWAAYLRPGAFWHTPDDAPGDRPGDLVLTWRRRLDDPRVALLLDTPEGALYRRLR